MRDSLANSQNKNDKLGRVSSKENGKWEMVLPLVVSVLGAAMWCKSPWETGIVAADTLAFA